MKRTGTVHKSRRGRERDGKQHVRELDAYMTVEASFVIPMALCLIVLTIYLSFYMYNKCVLTQDCARAAIRNAAMKAIPARSRRRKRYSGTIILWLTARRFRPRTAAK